MLITPPDIPPTQEKVNKKSTLKRSTLYPCVRLCRAEQKKDLPAKQTEKQKPGHTWNIAEGRKNRRQFLAETPHESTIASIGLFSCTLCLRQLNKRYRSFICIGLE